MIQISWHDKKTVKWSRSCQNHCLYLPQTVLASTSVESPDSLVTTVIPKEYLEFKEVFSKTKASGLPPHRPYNCAIDLLPGTTPPHIYLLFNPPLIPCRTTSYGGINAGCTPSGIYPSIYLPCFSWIFFCGLHPCIDDRGLNQIAVKYPYPLPLVPSALEQLCAIKISTKLDHCNVYNLVHVRKGKWKTAFSTTFGYIEYCFMTYRLFCAYSGFQCLINDVLRDMLGKFVIADIDKNFDLRSHF